jgi:hypothetical protein
LYHLGPGSATPKSKKLYRGNPETPLDFFARCGIVVPVESVSDADRANGHSNGTDTRMDSNRFFISEVIDAAREVIPPYEAEDMDAFRAAAWGEDGDDGEDPPPAAPAALPLPLRAAA